MGQSILIIGESGTGKSTSLINLNSNETYVINVLDKPLPFRGWKNKYFKKNLPSHPGNYFSTDKSNEIIATLTGISAKRPDIKNIIIDDFQYVMSNEFMRRGREHGFGKFTDININAWEILYNCVRSLRDDLTVTILSHSHIGDDGISRIKTIGKMVDNHITIEGMFTYVFHTVIMDNEYKFLSKRTADRVAKTPIGIFEEKYINNDLKYILDEIEKYEKEDVTNEDEIHLENAA